jgi:hypothetical protein
METQALPLAVWLLFSVAAGAITYLLITGLFNLANYFAPQQHFSRRSNVEPAQSRSQTQSSNKAPKTAARSQANPEPTYTSASDDWDTDSMTDEDDWDFEEDTGKKQTPSSQNTVKDTAYEANTKPKSSYQTGSVYSYSYKEPQGSGVGKTESVYDADYRVITPPYQQPNKVKDQEEDWGFEDEDDFFEDEEPSDSPAQK